MNLEDYIKGLSPELQERARACSSVEELLALAKEAMVPVPDEVLEAVAGGEELEAGLCNKIKCPVCGCTRIGVTEEDLGNGYIRGYFLCTKCGYEWFNDFINPC